MSVPLLWLASLGLLTGFIHNATLSFPVPRESRWSRDISTSISLYPSRWSHPESPSVHLPCSTLCVGLCVPTTPAERRHRWSTSHPGSHSALKTTLGSQSYKALHYSTENISINYIRNDCNQKCILISSSWLNFSLIVTFIKHIYLRILNKYNTEKAQKV